MKGRRRRGRICAHATSHTSYRYRSSDLSSARCKRQVTHRRWFPLRAFEVSNQSATDDPEDSSSLGARYAGSIMQRSSKLRSRLGVVLVVTRSPSRISRFVPGFRVRTGRTMPQTALVSTQSSSLQRQLPYPSPRTSAPFPFF